MIVRTGGKKVRKEAFRIFLLSYPVFACRGNRLGFSGAVCRNKMNTTISHHPLGNFRHTIGFRLLYLCKVLFEILMDSLF